MNKMIQATQLGTHFAADGWTVDQVGQWLVDSGFDPDSLFVKNVMKGYQLQVNRI